MKSQVLLYCVNVTFLVRLQGKFESDQSWEWKGFKIQHYNDLQAYVVQFTMKLLTGIQYSRQFEIPVASLSCCQLECALYGPHRKGLHLTRKWQCIAGTHQLWMQFNAALGREPFTVSMEMANNHAAFGVSAESSHIKSSLFSIPLWEFIS